MDYFAALGVEAPTGAPEAQSGNSAGESQSGLPLNNGENHSFNSNGGGISQNGQDGESTQEVTGPEADLTQGEQETANTAEVTGRQTEDPDAMRGDDDRQPDDGSQENGGQAGGGKDAEDGTKKPQSRGENAKFAAVRRKAEAERDAAIAKAREEARAEAKKIIDDTIAGMKIKNPDTGLYISTKEEYDAVLQKQTNEKIDKSLKKAGLDADIINQVIANHPLVKNAQKLTEEAERARAAAQKAKIDAQSEKAMTIAKQQIEEISKYDPGIKTLEDLQHMPDYDKFYDLVKKGNSLIGAFWALRGQQILAGRQDGAAKQAAINAVSKSHLVKSSTSGEGSPTVTNADFERFRIMFPSMSKKEITQLANQYAKNTKKFN